MRSHDKVKVGQSGETHHAENPDGRRHWGYRAALAAAGICIGVFLSECLLWSIDKPRFYKAHSSPPQFGPLTTQNPAEAVYVNKPSSRIRFVYDGNPRGYFGPNNEIDHPTNRLGFRGPEFESRKPTGTLRLLFLGDSFTFGEGVKFEDTYAEVAATILRATILRKEHEKSTSQVESLNFGVGGYNTTQSLHLLKEFGLAAEPDVVVLGYVINDAEPPLFEMDVITGQPRRRKREAVIREGLSDPLPPRSRLYRLRTAQLVWRYIRSRDRNAQTIGYYQSLYEPENPGWVESRRSLGDIIKICRDMDVPCYVVLFPLLIQLDDEHPFDEIYQLVGESVNSQGGIFINLIDHLRGMKGEDLWVHPTDQHPNERVHAIAARVLVEQLALEDSAK